MRLILLVLFCTALALSQSTHTVTLTWEDTRNTPIVTTYSVYRAPGACPTDGAVPAYVKISTAPIAPKTYTDSGVANGAYCYAVTAVADGLESDKSVPVTALVKPFPPTSLGAVVK